MDPLTAGRLPMARAMQAVRGYMIDKQADQAVINRAVWGGEALDLAKLLVKPPPPMSGATKDRLLARMEQLEKEGKL